MLTHAIHLEKRKKQNNSQHVAVVFPRYFHSWTKFDFSNRSFLWRFFSVENCLNCPLNVPTIFLQEVYFYEFLIQIMYYFVQPQSTFSFSWLFNFLGRTIKNNFYLDVFPVFITNIFYLPRYLIFILFSVYTILLIFCLFTFQQYTAMVM